MTSVDAKAVPREGRNVRIVHDLLRSGILAGDILSGETSQADLARRLDVGRTPCARRSGCCSVRGSSSPSPTEGCGSPSRTSGPAGIAELEGLLAQMNFYRRTEDFAGFRVPHRAFHEKLVSGAGERMTTLAAQLFDHGERYRVKFGSTTTKVWAERRAEHRAILDSAAEGDAEAAVREVVGHYGRTAALVFAGLGEDYDPRRLRVAIAAAIADPVLAADIL